MDGVLFLTIALLPRDKCLCDSADKRFRPHANARMGLKTVARQIDIPHCLGG